MKHLLQCMTRWTHDFSWPIHGVETCTRCGATRKAPIEFPVSPRFDVPRSDRRTEPKVEA